MKHFLKPVCTLLISAGMGVGVTDAQTEGTVRLNATLRDTGAGPDHWTVVWVTNATTGAYVRTLRRQSAEPRGSHWNQHCGSWYAAAGLATSATHFNPAPDGFTGATATTYASPNSPFTQTWNCKDATGATIPDGTYRLWIQYAEDTGGQGPVTTGGLLWTKGPSASTVNPANQGTNFTNLSIVCTPAVSVNAPEIAVEQPAGTNIPDAGSKGFGSVAVGSATPLVFTIRNTGNADLTGLAVSKDGANAGDFTITSNPTAPVAGPSGTTTFTVTFSPTSVGTRTAAIHIANNDSDEAPFDINLSGTGIAPAAPEIAVEQPAGTSIPDAGSKSFGSVVVGSSTPLVFTIRNTGNADLTGLAVSKDGANPGDFTIASNPTAPVAGPSGTTTFTVTFSPAAVGTRTAAIHIANNDADEAPFDINLSGTGLAAPEPPGIATQPASVGIVSGERATLTVVATGTAPAYQWYAGASGDTSAPVAGATAPSFTTPPLVAGATYWVRVSNGAGVSDSNTAAVSITGYVLSTSAVHGMVAGAGVYGVAAEATLTATPDAGFVFSGWTGDASGTANPLTVRMDSNKSIGAAFSPDPSNPADPFVTCFVGSFFEPRVGDRITLDFNRLAGAGETVRLKGKLPAGIVFNPGTGMASGVVTAKPGTYRVAVQILKGRTQVKTVDLTIPVLPFPESLAGDYEGILEDAGGIPSGVVRISIAATNSWMATLETAGAKKRSAKGQCELTPGAAVAGVSAVFPAASGVPAEAVTFSVDGGSPNFAGTFGGGVVRGFRLAKGAVVPASATPCTMVLDAGSQDGINVPAGFGWLKGTMGVKGAGVFAGMLGDATPVSVSLRLSPAGQAVVWAQPYPDKRSFIGGIVTLEGLGLPASGDKLADGLWWQKAADSRSQSYPNGFPAMRITLGASKWVVPSSAVELGASLGWRDNRLTSVTTEGAGFDNQDPLTPFMLPQELTMDDSFNLRVSAVSPAASDADDDDGDDDHDDRDDDDDRDDTLKNLWSGKVSRFDGSFAGMIKLFAGGADGIGSGNAPVSGVLVQGESWGVVTGCGLVKVPIAGGKGAYRTAAFILGQ